MLKAYTSRSISTGAKTIKIYSLFVLNSSEAKEETPSIAMPDTLVLFVLDAPYTDEIQQKDNERHYSY